MGLKSYRVEYGDSQVEYFDEDKTAAIRFAVKKVRKTDETAHVVFATADTFVPMDARYTDQGERVYSPHYPPYSEGNFA